MRWTNLRSGAHAKPRIRTPADHTVLLLDVIRQLFAQYAGGATSRLPPVRFSFNSGSKAGVLLEGARQVKLEMNLSAAPPISRADKALALTPCVREHLAASVYYTLFNRETSRYLCAILRGRNISQVLDLEQ
jgi:hypothetical protein